MPLLSLFHRPVGRSLPKMLLLASLLFVMVSCGKRPPDVDPPLGAEGKVYPRIYPQPEAEAAQ